MRILLINPSYSNTYGSSKAMLVNAIAPTLGLTTVAAQALKRGHHVEIMDLSHRPYDWRGIKQRLLDLKPDIVGITATTPLMNQLRDISVLCKDVSRDILVLGGGAHVSALPGESMRETLLDVAVVGEGDLTFGELCDGRPPKDVAGVYYRDGGGRIVATPPRPPMNDLDSLPLPAWHLYDPAYYRDKVSRLLARQVPLTIAEFSRGCVYKCDFCASKMTMALGYRKKSPERCAEEVKVLHRLGWREFLLADDIFSSDNEWATRVSEEITRADTGVAWSCTNGIRVESANDRLFKAMRAAGCYRVSFGFESGNDAVLRAFGKGGRASLDMGRQAVRMARRAGIDTCGYFMIGLSADDESTIRDTIAFARTLELDMLKFGITIAFPGTPMFNSYVAQGLVRSYDWDDYHIYSSKPLFAHPRLTYDVILRYMKIAYRSAIILNPGFVARRLVRGVKTGEFFWDLLYSLKYVSLSAVADAASIEYYAQDRWPRHDFRRDAPTEYAYQRASHKKPEDGVESALANG
jgi:radical SAM superfamily enzyme YgiQ (UPF0313 family)